MKKIVVLIGLLVFSGSISGAQDESNFGYVSGLYSVGALKKVAKNKGTLEISIQLKCIDSASDIDKKMEELASTVSEQVKLLSEFETISKPLEISTSSLAKYEMRYADDDKDRLNPFYFDVCNGKKVNLSESIDLTLATFMGKSTLKIETKKNLSALVELRQKLQVFQEDFNKTETKKHISVEKESIVVSEEKQSEVYSDLANSLDLRSTLSRLTVDEKFNGGFKELYITKATTQRNGRPEHLRFSPKLTDKGKSEVSVPYVFNIEYIPSDLISSESVASLPKKEKGNMEISYTGKAVVETDYYVANLKFYSSCHKTKASSTKAMAKPFAQLLSDANKVIDPNGNSPYERMDVKINEAFVDLSKFQVFEKEVVRRGDDSVTRAKSYINLCDANIIPHVPNEKQYVFAIFHQITLVTSNFLGLKKLAKVADEFTEKQRESGKANRVEVSLSSIVPRLKDENHFNAVKVLAYESALKQLLDPNGEANRKLRKEIRAKEAFFSSKLVDVIRPRYSEGRSASPAKDSAEDAYEVVEISDENIPLSDLRLDTVYAVVYRPTKDLVTLLREAERSAEVSIQP